MNRENSRNCFGRYDSTTKIVEVFFIIIIIIISVVDVIYCFFLFQVVLSLLLCEIYVPVNVIVSLNSSRRMLRTWRTPSSPYNTVGLRNVTG